MSHKKQNLHTIKGPTKSIYDLEVYWTDAFRQVFEPNTKRLFTIHKVPKFKQRHVNNW